MSAQALANGACKLHMLATSLIQSSADRDASKSCDAVPRSQPNARTKSAVPHVLGKTYLTASLAIKIYDATTSRRGPNEEWPVADASQREEQLHKRDIWLYVQTLLPLNVGGAEFSEAESA